MTRDLVIFGIGAYAEQVHHYFSVDPRYRVTAFTVDAEFIEGDAFCGLPVIAAEEIVANAHPQRCDMFVALGYNRINEVRKAKVIAARALGYTLASYVHASAQIARGVEVKDNTFICEQALVRPFSRLGCDLQIGAKVTIGHNNVVGDHCFFAMGAALCGGVELGERCFIGANATLRDHIAVGERCVIGAGAVILSDCAPDGVYRTVETARTSRGSDSLRSI